MQSLGHPNIGTSWQQLATATVVQQFQSFFRLGALLISLL